MSINALYYFIQQLFPSLSAQRLPEDGLDHFGEFIDWINLNQTYIQPFFIDQPLENGFEYNQLFSEYQIPVTTLTSELEQKITKRKTTSLHTESLLQQELLRSTVLHTHNFLEKYQIDILLFQTSIQYFWLSFPKLRSDQRKEFCQLLKTSFNHDFPILVLDPKVLALFVNR